MSGQFKKTATGRKNQSAMENLKIEDVVELGGDEVDYKMVQFDDDNESLELNSDSSDSENLQNEVKELISTLGFGKKKNTRNDSEINILTKTKATDEMKTSDKCAKEPNAKAAKQPQDEKLKNKKKRKAQDDRDDSHVKEIKKAKRQETSGNGVVQSNTKTAKQPNSTAASIALDLSHKLRTYLLVKPGKWTDNQFSDEAVSCSSLPEKQVDQLEQFAKNLLDEEVALYRSKQDRKGPSAWMKKVLASGTAADKMAGLIVLVQDSPLHNLSSLDNLISMLKMKERRKSLTILESVKKLFLTDLLPDQKLKAFHQQPLSQINVLASGNKDTRDKRLLIWCFESQLKQKYEAFIRAVEILSHDTIELVKSKAITAIFDMLCEKPEQEKVLLSLLVNKVGDPVRKVAARTAHLLSKLVERHPNMKMVVTSEVERLLYRSNVTLKAQYYAVCFLSGLQLNSEESQLASHLVTIYFSFFKSFVAKGEIDSKMLSGLLAGVNRAYAFAKVDQQKIMEQSETLFRLIHVSKFNTSVQALMLLFQIVDISETSADRYYMALYCKLYDDELASSAKLPMFLNLVLKSVKKDSVETRVQAFIKRLLQLAASAPELDCSTLLLLSELLKDRPHLLKPSMESEDSDDEEEHFVDVKVKDDDDDYDAEAAATVTETKSSSVPTHVASSWIHRQNLSKKRVSYDPTHRNPLFSRAGRDCNDELCVLAGHFHPSVKLFGNKLLQGQSLDYTSNPLEDFSVLRSLDRTVTHNLKTIRNGAVKDGESLDNSATQMDSDDDADGSEYDIDDDTDVDDDDIDDC